MNNLSSQDYNLYESNGGKIAANYSISGSETKCLGKGCKRFAEIFLKINYLNKIGCFCDKCAEDLLNEGLAVRVGNLTNE